MKNSKSYTDEEIKGINLAVKSVKKQYPFVVGWKFSEEYSHFEVFTTIDLKVNLSVIEEIYNTGPVNKYQNYEKFLNPFMPFDWGGYQSEKWKTIQEKGHNIRENIKKMLESTYSFLPDEYVRHYMVRSQLHSSVYEKEYRTELTLDNFYI